MGKRRYWAEGDDVLGTNEFTSYGLFDTFSSPRDTLGHLRLAPSLTRVMWVIPST